MNQLNSGTFNRLLESYIFTPLYFWPEETIFHRRNREKLIKARAMTKDLDDSSLLSLLRDDLNKRFNEQCKTLYVISCGSSGCHFLGEMLSSIGNFDLIKEVYYPPKMLSIRKESALSEAEKIMLLDLVSYFPSKGVPSNQHDVVPVNIMHLRPDTPTQFIKEMGNNYIILLIRNPFDIAYSRTFRKTEYRMEVDPCASDLDYLRKQIQNVKRFYRLAHHDLNVFDYIVRYEDLLRDPYPTVHDMLFASKSKFPGEWDARSSLFEAINKVNSSKSINYNPISKKRIDNSLATLLVEELSDLATSLGYGVPSHISLC